MSQFHLSYSYLPSLQIEPKIDDVTLLLQKLIKSTERIDFGTKKLNGMIHKSVKIANKDFLKALIANIKKNRLEEL